MYKVEFRTQLPEYFRNIKDFQAILNAEEPEFLKFAERMEEINNNFFIATADSDTITFWETILSIESEKDDDLDFRRFRVISSIATKPPFTYPYLLERLNEMYGSDGYTMSINHATGVMDIKLKASTYQALKYLYTLMYIVLPANIAITIEQNMSFDGNGSMFSGGIGVVTQLCVSNGLSTA